MSSIETLGIGFSPEDGSSEEGIAGDLLKPQHPLRSVLSRRINILPRVLRGGIRSFRLA